jgi:hypothetical protein
VNKIDLGKDQLGKKADDVELPKWANNDPIQFISIMRAAL